jgi:CHRD domain
MRKPTIIALVVLLLSVMAFSASALADGDGNHSSGARLTGYEETPAINSAGAGQFSASVNSSGTTIMYRLSYSGLSSAAAVAHIHFGQRGVAGGVVAFLCGGGNKPPCPASGTVTGTIVSSDIIAVPAQGIAAGDLAGVLRAMRAGLTYANVHTANFPNGEIRGQIKGGEDDDD